MTSKLMEAKSYLVTSPENLSLSLYAYLGIMLVIYQPGQVKCHYQSSC